MLSPKKKVFVKTFGCQMNEYDTEKILSLLRNNYEETALAHDVDLVLINTCSVRHKAEKKLYDLLGRFSKQKKTNTRPIIGVCGCVAQQEGQRILKRIPAVDFVVGTHNISLIPSLVKNAENGLPRSVCVDYRTGWDDLGPSVDEVAVDSFINPNNSSAFGAYYSPMRALVAIQRGCNKHCSFCVVPTTRGPEVSRSMNEVIREIQAKISHGAKEIMLLGQTVNSYGRDLSPRITFEELVKRIMDIKGVLRLRFFSPHPQDVTSEFIALYRDYPQLCSHIHMPVQSGSDKILRHMRRNYRISRYKDIIAELQAARPGIAITSDFIVGFPNESEDDFQQTLNLLEEVKYSFSYSFKYSPRPNTRALEFSEKQLVPDEESNKRLAILQNAQKRLSLEFNQNFVNKTIEVFVEGNNNKNKEVWRTRTDHNIAAELNGSSYEIGMLLERRVESASPYGLRLAD